jgi:hypothetical protein
MSLKTGMRLFAQNWSCEVTVVKSADTVGSLSRAGLDMLPAAVPSQAAGQAQDGPLIELGKRYTDEDNLVEILCTKPGAKHALIARLPRARRPAPTAVPTRRDHAYRAARL